MSEWENIGIQRVASLCIVSLHGCDFWDIELEWRKREMHIYFCYGKLKGSNSLEYPAVGRRIILELLLWK
jgi:hypothetical protein